MTNYPMKNNTIHTDDSKAEPTIHNRWVPAASRLREVMAAAVIPSVAGFGAVMNRVFGRAGSSRAGILMYHRIAPKVPDAHAPTINVTPRRFRSQLVGLLKRGYQFWPLEKLIEHHENNEDVPDKVACVTFDDGFQNVALHAVPVLEELKIHATIFVATGYVGSSEPFPFDHWGLKNKEQVPDSAYLPLSLDECRQLADSEYITLGAHTHTHEDFRYRPEAFEDDLQKCLHFLRENLGIESPLFAFPYGTPRHGFADHSLQLAAKRQNVRCAVNTGPEAVDLRTSPFQWGRFNAFAWDNGETLAAMLSGWYTWANNIRNRIGRTFLSLRDMTRRHCERPIPVFDGCGSYETDGDELPTISVIVPTYNRAHWLDEALATLEKQATEGLFKFDVLVIDNASSDNTREVVESRAAKSPITIHYCHQTTPGDAPTRNEGLRRSTSDWYAFFDDDQLAVPHWLAGLFKATRDCESRVVGGPVLLDLPDDELERLGPICRRALRELNYYSRLHPYIEKDLPGTGNAMVAREVFDEVGLFDESMTSGGSDSDFFMRAARAGHSLWFTPNAPIRHRISRERLTPAFFRWDALSGGAAHAAYFDQREKGVRGLLWTSLLRMTHGVVCVTPAYLWARLLRDDGNALGRRTQLWRTEGYIRRTLSVLAPKIFAQTAFFESLEFRNGRTVAATTDDENCSETDDSETDDRETDDRETDDRETDDRGNLATEDASDSFGEEADVDA